jgi:RecJ-like exonuclease
MKMDGDTEKPGFTTLGDVVGDKEVQFLVDSEILERLRPRFISTAKLIRKAVSEGRPIIVRHHADCDGYSAGFALEKAIMSLIFDKSVSKKAAWKYFRRAPSKSPIYEYMDVTKDVVFFLTDMARNKTSAPLMILADCGSHEENIPAIKKLKAYGALVAVVDHHYPGELIDGGSKGDFFLDAHINPHLVGGDSKICAGMLCTELARFINKNVSGIAHLPALSGVADRCVGPHMEGYLKIAKENGYDQELLTKLPRCLDYEFHYIGFLEAREKVTQLMSLDAGKHREFVSMLYDNIEAIWQSYNPVVKKHMEVKRIEDRLIYGMIDAQKTTIRGNYFSASKICRLAFDLLHEKFPDEKMVVIGYGSEMFTLRADNGLKDTEGNDFSLPLMLAGIKEKLPHALAEGGGHDVAGSVRFLEASGDEVMDAVFDYVKRFS